MKKSIMLLLFFLMWTNVYSKEYKSGDVHTVGTFLYGKFEAYIKVPKINGVIASFFLIKQESWRSEIFWQEIDFEIFCKDPCSWQSNIITGYPPEETSGKTHKSHFDLSNGYHLYTIEWTPESITWYIDNVECCKENNRQIESCDSPMEIHFSLWPSVYKSWASDFNESALPVYQYID